MSELELARAGQESAAAMTSDMRATYNMASLPGIAFSPLPAPSRRAPSVFSSVRSK